MKDIDSFKLFVRTNPSLIKFVKNNEMTWQKFYELWFLYGEDDEVWDKYTKTVEEPKPSEKEENPNLSFNDVVNMFRKMDSESVSKSIASLQKGIALLQDLLNKNAPTSATETYSPRPLFRRFED
jgi:hypothetical protein